MIGLGGHNPLEAAQYGCPILMGPYTDVVQGICSELQQAGALHSIRDVNDFILHASEILNDRAMRVRLGEAARLVAQRHRGASTRILNALNQFISDTHQVTNPT